MTDLTPEAEAAQIQEQLTRCFGEHNTLCPECDHGIDPHGADPGGPCGVGGCPCLMQPSGIACAALDEARQRIEAAEDAAKTAKAAIKALDTLREIAAKWRDWPEQDTPAFYASTVATVIDSTIDAFMDPDSLARLRRFWSGGWQAEPKEAADERR